MKKEIQEFLQRVIEDIIRLRPETFFIVFLFLFLSIFPVFHVLFLFTSLVVVGMYFYQIYEERRRESDEGERGEKES